MSEPLIAPAPDAIVVAYLNTLLTPPVATDVPDPRPAEFVRVLVTGGGGRRDLVLQDAQITVEAWAATYADASELMMLADAHMHNARFVDADIRNVRAFGAPINLPDPTSGQSRMTATYEVTLRASAL